jgi:hypothetical protein
MLTWHEMALLPEGKLARRDIAETNLSCADGLPGSDAINHRLCFEKLDYLARWAANYTDECLVRFHAGDRQSCETEAQFRMQCLVTVLQKGAGIDYNPTKKDMDYPFDIDDLSIHGVLEGRGGTCATLPVVFIAVGRRLGYPLRLVAAALRKDGELRFHSFVRWDEPGGEHFNYETTGRGFCALSDDHFRDNGLTRQEEQWGGLLKSLTPREELSAFMEQRGFCLLDTTGFRQAANSFAWAWALAPHNKFIKNRYVRTYNDWLTETKRRLPPRFPEVYTKSLRRRFPDTLPLDYEKDLLGLETVNNLLNDQEFERQWWAGLRAGYPWINPPSIAEGMFTPHECVLSLRFHPCNCDPFATKG